METRRSQVPALTLIVAVLVCTACLNKVQLYEGPARPESEESILYYYQTRNVVRIVRVDGEPLVLPETSALRDEGYASLHLLPGEHTLFLCPSWSLHRGTVAGSKRLAAAALGVGWEGTSDEQKAAVQEGMDGWTLRFVAEAGRGYLVGADDAGELIKDNFQPTWEEYSIEPVILGPDTLLLSRPFGWESWAPYVEEIVRDGDNRRVGEIVSGSG